MGMHPNGSGLFIALLALSGTAGRGDSQQRDRVHPPAPVPSVGRDVGAGLLTPDHAPVSWTIESGTHAGTTVVIDAALAASNRRDKSRFWRLSPRGSGPARVVGWRALEYPIPVAFDRGGWREEITPADSAGFWTILRQMESDIGIPLFRPATVSGSEDPQDVILVRVAPQGTAGHAFITWNSFGDVYDARVSFRNAISLRDSRVVTHEMMHALGFGHAQGWPSVMTPTGSTSEHRLTPQDVAYTQVAFAARGRQEALIGAAARVAAGTRELPASCSLAELVETPEQAVTEREAPLERKARLFTTQVVCKSFRDSAL